MQFKESFGEDTLQILQKAIVEIFSHELHESHRGTHVRDIEHD